MAAVSAGKSFSSGSRSLPELKGLGNDDSAPINISECCGLGIGLGNLMVVVGFLLDVGFGLGFVAFGPKMSFGGCLLLGGLILWIPGEFHLAMTESIS